MGKVDLELVSVIGVFIMSKKVVIIGVGITGISVVQYYCIDTDILFVSES